MYLPLVLLHLVSGHPSAVLADMQKPAASAPSEAEAKDKIGEALADRKDDKGAIKAYDEAIRLKPDYADAYIDRGLSHGSSGNSNTPRVILTKQSTSAPKNGLAYFNRAVFRNAQGNIKRRQ